MNDLIQWVLPIVDRHCPFSPAGTDPSISTRVKMGQSSNIYALVKADGKYYVASKEIKVTLGGCGG